MTNGEKETKALTRLIAPKDFTEAMEIAGKLAASDLVPKAYRGKPANIVIAWEMGAEVGLSPMTALQSIAVIGGKPVMYGEAPLGVVIASGLLEEIIEEDDGEVATCTVKRKGWPKAITRTFSMEEARRAKVYERDEQGNGKWTILADRWTYQSWPKDMRKFRARGRAVKDAFADVLKGLDIGEAVRDMGDLTAANPVVIETEKVGDQYMPKQKAPEPPPAEPVTPAAETATAPAGQGTSEAYPEPAVSGSVSTAPADGSITPDDGSATQEAPVKPRAARPRSKAVDTPSGAGGGPAGAQDRESGQGATAPPVEPVQGADVPPPVPAVAKDGPTTFTINGVEYKTKGITEDQLMASFKLVPQVDRKMGKGTSRTLLMKMFALQSRTELTATQGAQFLTALEKALV